MKKSAADGEDVVSEGEILLPVQSVECPEEERQGQSKEWGQQKEERPSPTSLKEVERIDAAPGGNREETSKRGHLERGEPRAL